MGRLIRAKRHPFKEKAVDLLDDARVLPPVSINRQPLAASEETMSVLASAPHPFRAGGAGIRPALPALAIVEHMLVAAAGGVADHLEDIGLAARRQEDEADIERFDTITGKLWPAVFGNIHFDAALWRIDAAYISCGLTKTTWPFSSGLKVFSAARPLGAKAAQNIKARIECRVRIVILSGGAHYRIFLCCEKRAWLYGTKAGG